MGQLARNPIPSMKNSGEQNGLPRARQLDGAIRAFDPYAWESLKEEGEG